MRTTTPTKELIMTNTTKPSKVVGALSNAGKRTAKGVGHVGLGMLNILAAAGDIQKRNEIREKLECINDWDLEIAKELIEERIAKK
jgi:hypothetical protein